MLSAAFPPGPELPQEEPTGPGHAPQLESRKEDIMANKETVVDLSRSQGFAKCSLRSQKGMLPTGALPLAAAVWATETH